MTEKAYIIQKQDNYPTMPQLQLLCAALSAFIFFWDIVIPLGVAMNVLYIMVVLTSFWAKQKAFTVTIAIICSMLTIISVFFQPTVPEMWKVIFNRCIGLGVIWVTAVLGVLWKKSEERREQALNEREIAINEKKNPSGNDPDLFRMQKNQGFRWSLDPDGTLYPEPFGGGFQPRNLPGMCEKALPRSQVVTV